MLKKTQSKHKKKASNQFQKSKIGWKTWTHREKTLQRIMKKMSNLWQIKPMMVGMRSQMLKKTQSKFKKKASRQSQKSKIRWRT